MATQEEQHDNINSSDNSELAIVMRPTKGWTGSENCYDIWYPELKGSITQVKTAIKFEIGEFMGYEKGVIVKCDDPPVRQRRLFKRSEKNTPLLGLPTKFLKPEDEYFSSSIFPSGLKKYKKYFALSPDLGPIFLNKAVGEQMISGVLYELEVCNFALLDTDDEKDKKIISVMESMNTLWLGGLVDKTNAKKPEIAALSEQEWEDAKECIKKYGYILKPELTKQLQNEVIKRQAENQSANGKAEIEGIIHNTSQAMQTMTINESPQNDAQINNERNDLANSQKEKGHWNIKKEIQENNIAATTSAPALPLVDTTMNITNITLCDGYLNADSTYQFTKQEDLVPRESTQFMDDQSKFIQSLATIIKNAAVRNCFANIKSLKELNVLDEFIENNKSDN